jgi:hypothetical protein
MSLDGYIAGPKGEADWIIADREGDFEEIWAQFNKGLMGRLRDDAAVSRFGEAAIVPAQLVDILRASPMLLLSENKPCSVLGATYGASPTFSDVS